MRELAPQSIIIQAEAQVQKKDVFVMERKHFASDEEFIHYLTHCVNNNKHKDGRIYYKLEDGKLVANSVSPYADKFDDNIEVDIKPLVMALKKKRYLTYSSCMGHGATFRRYVGLAFADEESRQYVADYIESLNLFGVELRFFSNVANSIVTKHENTNMPVIQKGAPTDELTESEINTFNIQFHRNYSHYCFMEIVILKEITPENTNWKNYIKHAYILFLKKYFWNKITQKITMEIESPNFKKYKF